MTITKNITTDQSALLALRAHVSMDPQQILAKNWSINSSVCDWIGVICGSRHRRVIALNISNMGLIGLIPPQLGNLSFLVSLDMSRNNFQGELPQEFARLRRLQLLKLGVNNLNGELPPWISSFHKLQYLSLGNNSFTGLIPPSFSNMSKLETFYLYYNSLYGNIPKEIFNISSLKVLSLHGNNLYGSIPDYMCQNLHRLNSLSLSLNYLSGPIPSSLGQCSKLQLLSLSYNQFSGFIPKEIGNLKALETLYLGTNHLEGEIPKEIGNSTMLKVLALSSNSITGAIPKFLGDLRLLEELYLDDNNLMDDSSSRELGFISLLTNCKFLRMLFVLNNPLNGIIPESIGNLSTSLEVIYASNCNIKGGIPAGIGNLSSLIILSLLHNSLTGSLPSTIKELQNLQVIYLGENKLREISLDYLCLCQNLGVINLQENQISGSIPECLGNVTSLRYVYLGSNRLSSTLPANIWNLKDLLALNLSKNLLSGPIPLEIQNLKHAILIDLSRNLFSGDIPSTIGDMENLHNLSLAYNRLQRSIPQSIGKMVSLENLDLSHNFLSGSVPMSMEKLQYLTYLNVSFNNLSGEIPSGGPFLNFSSELFISNYALCGARRFHVPPCPTISAHKSRIKKVNRIIFILLGVITVVGVVSFAFVYLRYRRKKKVPKDQADLSLVATLERVSYYKLLQATDGYSESNLLGTGSFGSVYKATLEDGWTVAVKVFNLQVEGAFKSFDLECEVLRNLRHRNLTKVISSCSNPDFKALVLEFMPNGSLEKWLYSHNYFLDIMQRLDILIDVAGALQYLHCEYSTKVIHCDMKPSNILLDEAMVAHVSDFGIAKLLGEENSITYTKTLTTLCYFAPEYGLEGLVSAKCDIYSFGIMMMEVFTRTNPNSEMFRENLSLKSWVNDSILDGLAHIIDANLLMASDEYFLEKLNCISSIMKLALNCTRESSRERSNIQDVLVALKKIKVQLLPYIERL